MNNHSNNDSEHDFFLHAMRDVRLSKETSPRLFPKSSTHFRFKPKLTQLDCSYPFSNYFPDKVSAEELLFFSHSGLNPRFVSALKQGKIPQTAFLDLHTMTTDQARRAVSQFLQVSLQQEHRCVRIIHGKGIHSQDGPILKNYLNGWLREYPGVAAFCSTQPAEGGSGALAVLLHRCQFSKAGY